MKLWDSTILGGFHILLLHIAFLGTYLWMWEEWDGARRYGNTGKSVFIGSPFFSGCSVSYSSPVLWYKEDVLGVIGLLCTQYTYKCRPNWQGLIRILTIYTLVWLYL